jgi:hypothetical protein
VNINSKAASLTLLAICQIATMALWFSATAVVPSLEAEFSIGAMLTMQTALGFLLTLFTIHLMPLAVEWMGWRYAFLILAPGPVFGVWAMARLRAHPDSRKLAGGRR